MNYDLPIGQTATEQPHIWVFKSDKSLLITDNRIKDDTRLVLKSVKAVRAEGCISVRVSTNKNFSGIVFVENGHRLKYSVEIGTYNI